MKLRRFVAADMRSALALIKEELGPDAVIMSNKRVENGVEIIAGYDEVEKSNTANTNNTTKSSAQKGRITATVNSAVNASSSLKRYLEEGVGDDDVQLSSASNAQNLTQAKNTAKSINTSQERTASSVSSATDSTGEHLSPQESFARSLLEILERQKSQGKLPQSGSALKKDAEFLTSKKVTPQKALDSQIPKAQANNVQANNKAVSKTEPVKKPVSKNAKAIPPKPIASRSEIKELLQDIEQERQKNVATEQKHGMASYAKNSFLGNKENELALENGNIAHMRDELQSLRKLLQFELAGLIRDKGVREQPVRAMIAEILSSSGFEMSLAQKLSSKIDPDASVNFAWRELREILIRELKTGNDEIIKEGGVITLVGPAGVGKTTTAAKLAARFVIKYGPQAVALVCADHYRIGAVEQMKTYGRIMGCDTFAVKSLAQLRELLPSLAKKSLVIVDTAGVGSADERFEKQLADLKSQQALHLRHYLVLPATSQRRVLEEAGAHFASLSLRGLILTKTDESPSLCDALSVCIKNGLPLCYTTCGQRVPEDLKTADAKAFVNEALSGVENETARWALGEE